MPAYHADPWVVRGKFVQQTQLEDDSGHHSQQAEADYQKHSQTIKDQVLDTKERQDLAPPCESKIEKKRTKATAAAHSLRSKARKRNRTNRNTSETRSATIKLFDILAMIVRAPRNCHSGPVGVAAEDRRARREQTTRVC